MPAQPRCDVGALGHLAEHHERPRTGRKQLVGEMDVRDASASESPLPRAAPIAASWASARTPGNPAPSNCAEHCAGHDEESHPAAGARRRRVGAWAVPTGLIEQPGADRVAEREDQVLAARADVDTMTGQGAAADSSAGSGSSPVPMTTMRSGPVATSAATLSRAADLTSSNSDAAPAASSGTSTGG